MVNADTDKCDAAVTVPAPGITNPCNEVYTVFNNSPYKTSDTDASGTYPIGTTTVTWTITDASGNVNTCTQYVTVNDALPTIDCPADIIVLAEYELPYKGGVTIPDPDYDDNCPDPVLSWTLVPAAGYESEYDLSELSGTGVYPSPNTFYVGVTTITYMVTDTHSHTATCSFSVTVIAEPVIDCPDDIITTTDPGKCTATLDPGVPILEQGVPPITWTYTITNPDGTIGATATYVKDAPDQGPNAIGDYPFEVGTSTITWRAENVSGYDECFHTVTVTDDEPPTFTPITITECVDMLYSAVYTATSPNPNVGVDPNLIKNPSPDYYTFSAGDTSLDLIVLDDNCCSTASMTINWRIEFTDVPDPINPPAMISHPDITGTGQPSDYIDPVSGLPANIYMWGDGVNFTPVTHSIFYWVEDCHGNTTGEQRGEINITPRPKIIKMN
jgi:hypothetical protein